MTPSFLTSALASLMFSRLVREPVERRGIPEFSATKRYACGKNRGTVRANHRHRANVNRGKLAEARRKTAKLNGNPPGYRIQHHDALVREYGAVRTRVIEPQIFRGERSFAEVMA